MTRVGNNFSATVNCNVILEEEVNYKGPCHPPPRRKKTTLLRNILKPLDVVSGNSVSENIKKRRVGKKLTNQTCSGIQKRVSQKPYEGKLQEKAKMMLTKQDKLEVNKDLEEMEEEEGTDLERGEGAPTQSKGILEDRNRKILSEAISDQNQSQRPVYKSMNPTWEPSKCTLALIVLILRADLV